MDGMEPHGYDTDSEMLDDAAEQTCFAAVHSPLQDAVNTEMPSETGQFFEPAGSADNQTVRSQPSVLGHVIGDSTIARTVSPERNVSALPTDLSGDEAGIKTIVLAKIETIFEAMVDVLLNERGQLSVAIKTRPSPQRQQLDPSEATGSHGENVQQLCFPGKTEKEAWRFGESEEASALLPHY